MSSTLRLTIVEPAGGPDAERERVISSGPLRVGREGDNDWSIDDPALLMSRHHCTFDVRAGVFVIIDTSSNGVFINSSALPLGRGNTAIVKEGDRFRLGSVVLEARLGTVESHVDPFLTILPGEAGRLAPPPAPEPDPFHKPRGDGFPTVHLRVDDEMMSLPPPEDDSFSALLPQRGAFDFGTGLTGGGLEQELGPEFGSGLRIDPGFTRPPPAQVESDHVPAHMQAYQPAAMSNFHIPEDWADDEPDYPAPLHKPLSVGDDPLLPSSPAPSAQIPAGLPPAITGAPAGLPVETQQALIEALCTIVQSASPTPPDLLAGTAGEVLERLATLEPEWAGLELASIAARISTLRHEREHVIPQVPVAGKDA